MFCTSTGLPVVLPPAKGEVLGSWLMRIAQFYGLSLNALWSRVGAANPSSGCLPHWFALRPGVLDIAPLASALRVQPRQLSTMAPPGCRPHWPTELGTCSACLEDAAVAQQPLAWPLRWTHPLAVACPIHRRWLTPVATRELVRIRSAAELLGLRSQVEPASVDERANIADALWAQRAAFSKSGTRTPWGRAEVLSLMRVLPYVDEALVSASDEDLAELGLPGGWQRSQTKDFRLELGRGGMLRMTLPQGLIHRRWLITAAGHILRRPPGRRRMLRKLPEQTIKALACSWFSARPSGLVQWISPEAAALHEDYQSRSRHRSRHH